MLEINNLYCGYDGIDVVKDVSIKVERGQNLSIVGPNGCGKTTMLKAIANLIEYKGNIKLQGEEIRGIKRKNLAKKVAFMTQSSEVYFPYTVYETVALGRYAHIEGAFSSLSKKDKEIVIDCIENVGLLEYKDRLINELSGGQLQRVYLARAFAQDPDIILLDEPTNHLDLKCQIEILQHINKWTKENNKTVIGVLHDLNLVQYFADKVLMLDNGEEAAYGNPQEVLSGSIVNDIYGIDIKDFMMSILKKWA